MGRNVYAKRNNSKKNLVIISLPNDLLDIFKNQTKISDLEHDFLLSVKEYLILLKINLSERERSAIYKFYFAGMSQGKIAKEFKISSAAVAVYLQRARKKIAKYFGIDLTDKKNLRKQFLSLRKSNR